MRGKDLKLLLFSFILIACLGIALPPKAICLKLDVYAKLDLEKKGGKEELAPEESDLSKEAKENGNKESEFKEINIKEEFEKWKKVLSSVEEVVRKSEEKQAFVLLWQAKELFMKAKIDDEQGKIDKVLSFLQEMAEFISKANNLACSSLDLSKKITLRLIYLNKLILEVENLLINEPNKEMVEKAKNLLWKAKKTQVQSRMFLDDREKEKALSCLNEGAAYLKEALLDLGKDEQLDNRELAYLRLVKLATLIAETEKRLRSVNHKQAQDIFNDVLQVRKLALKAFKEEDYWKALEGTKISTNLISKVSKAIEVIPHHNKDRNKDDNKGNALKEGDPSRLVYLELGKGWGLIKKAKERLSLNKDNRLQKILTLSEKYFSKAYQCYQNKDLKEAMSNLRLSKSFALKVLEIANE
ncbi:hypothetical protein KJ849_08185 [bacterium]|nr:hypothetical protein [bacterium]